MAIPTKISLAAAAAFFVTAAQASDVPTLNVTPTCTPIGNDKTFPIDTKQCLKTEQEVREQLVKEWANFPAADRSLCTATASMGGMASYVALITCAIGLRAAQVSYVAADEFADLAFELAGRLGLFGLAGASGCCIHVRCPHY